MDVRGGVLKSIISFFIGFMLVSCFGEGGANDNAVEFASLCKLLNVVKAGLEPGNFPTIVDETWQSRLKKLEATYHSVKAVILDDGENVSAVVEKNKEGTVVEIKELTAGPSDWARDEQFKVIKKDAESLIKDLTNDLEEQSKVASQVQGQLKKALYGGESLNEVTASTTYHTTAGTACGSNGGTKNPGGPGASIAGDIFCLCANSNGLTPPCANGLGIAVAGFGNDQLKNSWSKVGTECGKPKPPYPFSAASLREALRGVLTLVGRHSGTSTQDAHRFVLGKGSVVGVSPGCDATSQSCVNYAGGSGGINGEMLEIDWANAVSKAASQLEEAQRRNQTIQENLKELKSVVREAISLYGLNERIATMTPKGLQTGTLMAPTPGMGPAQKTNSDLATKEPLTNSKSRLISVSLHELLIIISLA